MTYEESRHKAILELLDEGFSAQRIADARADDDDYLYDLIGALASRYFAEAQEKETKEEPTQQQKRMYKPDAA
jgi:hypothetical protein